MLETLFDNIVIVKEENKDGSNYRRQNFRKSTNIYPWERL